MSKQWQVIPLDALQEGVRNARRRSRQKAHTAQESTAGSTRQANTQGKSEQLIQPVTALLFMAALTKQQEQAIPKQQNQPAIKQQEQPAAKPVRKRKPAVRKPIAKPPPIVKQPIAPTASNGQMQADASQVPALGGLCA